MKKLVVSIIILFFIINIASNVSAKYKMEYAKSIGKIKIDREKPFIEIMRISENTKNNQKELNFRIKVVEKNIKLNNLNKNNVLVEAEKNIFSQKEIEKYEILQESDGIIYDIVLKDVKGIGKLSLIIKDSIIMDIANQWNEKVEFVYFLENL